MTTLTFSKQNLTNQNYFTTECIWTADETQIGSFFLFSVMNLQSRTILGFVISPERVSGEDVTVLLSVLLESQKTKTGVEAFAFPTKLIVDHGTMYNYDYLQEFLKTANIELDQPPGRFRQQVIESYDHRIKSIIFKCFYKKINPDKVKAFNTKQLTLKERRLSIKQRSVNKKIREKLFNSSQFVSDGVDLIETSLNVLNELECPVYKTNNCGLARLSRKQVDYFIMRLCNVGLFSGQLNDPRTQIVRSYVHIGLLEVNKNVNSLMKQNPGTELAKLLKTQQIDNKISYNFSNPLEMLVYMSLFQQQNIINQLKLLSFQNSELKESQNTLLTQNKLLLVKQNELLEKLTKIDEENAEKLARRNQYKNRKRKEILSIIKRDAFIKMLDSLNSPDFVTVRLKLCLLILYATGIRISELSSIKIKNLNSLWGRKNFIQVQRLKRGGRKMYEKAYLSAKGREFMKKYKQSFLKLKSFLNAEDAVITGTLQSPEIPINRAHLTREINEFLKRFDTETEQYRSHSFRKTHITDLWSKTSDIELVRQSVGHSSIATTSSYIHELDPLKRN